MSALPSWPRITSEVEIPVYLVHTDAGADDYFLFGFAAYFRETFQAQFNRICAEVNGEDYGRAWPLPDYVRAHLSEKESGAWW